MKLFKFALPLVLLLSGCLKTRNEVKDTEQKQVLQQQVVYLQKNTADSGNRFADLEEQMRYLSGRVEGLENKVNRGDNDSDRLQKTQGETLQEMNKKLLIYQEALTKLESQMAQLQNEVAKNKADSSTREVAPLPAAQQKAKAGSAPPKHGHETGQEFFLQKDWKAAIIEFQKYRDQYPRGKSFADATYKIGVCFQELNMKEDAKSFYQEVITRFPTSEEARRSRTRLKSLK
jgi:TolA-binding protein